MKSFKITALSLVLVLLLAACGAKNDTRRRSDAGTSYRAAGGKNA